MSKQWITLTAPHRHGGRDYRAGARLALAAQRAEWLIGIGKAAPASAPQPVDGPSAPKKPTTTPTTPPKAKE